MRRVRQVWALVRRNLIHTAREPIALSDVTVTPVLFTLLFVYVFGSGIPISGESYQDFAIPGLMLLNITTASMATAVGLSYDITTGAVARFRTLPMWQSALLVARSLSDLFSAALCLVVVALTGLAVGWRPHRNLASVAAGFGLVLLFSFALSWFSACLGILSPGPESAQGLGLVVLFPLALVSNALVPTGGMPGWMELIANWSPVSTTAAALRDLLGNTDTSASVHDWPMGHPIAATLSWVAILLATGAPAAAYLYRRRVSR